MGAGEPEPGVDDLGGRGDCAGYDCVGGGGDGGLTASITVPSSGRLRVSIAAYLYQSTAGKLTQWG